MVKRFLYRVLCGFFMGFGVFAPGFSGSVIAIIMGIYQDLLRITSNPFKNLKHSIAFCVPLVIGAAISGVLFVIVAKYLFDTYEKATYLLFVGLIAGNLPVIFADVKKSGFQKHYLAGAAGAFVVALVLCIFSAGAGQSAAATVGLTASLPILALSGIFAGITTMVPGTSVSMVLLIFGVYDELIYTVNSLLSLDSTYLAPFGFFCVCVIVGLVGASRVIKTVFEKYPGIANSTVFGFMAGSLFGILYQSLRISSPNFNWLLGVAMLAVGLGISMMFVILGRIMDKGSPSPN